MRSLAERITTVAPAATLAISARAKELAAQGKDVLDFSAGEPDFPTPKHICEAGEKAIRDGHTKYTQTPGIPALRDAIAARVGKELGIDVARDNVVVGCGAKAIVYEALQVLVHPGQEVLIPVPYWVSYPEMVRLAGGAPVPVPSRVEDAFAVTAEALEAAVTPRTSAIVFSSPCNPSGAVWGDATLRAVAEVAKRHDLWIISDEIYHRFVFDGQFRSIVQVAPDVADRTVVVNGFSKAYAMTGWRVGYCAAPLPIAKAIAKMQGHMTSNAATPAQYAALTALTDARSETEIASMHAAFTRRSKLMADGLGKLPKITCAQPVGAFYAFPDVSQWYGSTLGGQEVTDSQSFARAALEGCGVASVPGVAFGADAHVRLSYACSEETIQDGLNRLAKFLGG